VGENAWLQLAIQIPVVLVFSGVMYLIIKMFLTHISQSESRSQTFIEQQREKNDEAVSDLAVITRQSMERLTDVLCTKIEHIDTAVSTMRVLDSSHDAFVRTSFRERFGPAVADNADRDATEAELRTAREIERERKE